MDSTTQAYNTSMAAERLVNQLSTRRNALAQRWQDELRAVDRLKNSKSWRRESALRDKLSEAHEVGKQLEAVIADLAKAKAQLVVARRALVAAIDTEVAAGPVAPRRAQLDKARAQIMPQSRKAHRIVLPNMQIDTLADPEELDQQVAAFRESETELQNQIKGIEAQATELDRIAILRKQHERARDMEIRDDNSSRKGATPNGRGATEAVADPSSDMRPGDMIATFEQDATITLAEVVDTTTLDTLKKAQRSGDPSKRAAAARQTRDAVAKKLEQLRAKRKQIEERAKQLRSKR